MADASDEPLNPAYLGPRADVLALLSRPPARVLDVGCSAGALGEHLKRRHAAEVTGLELLPQAARRAEQVLDRVLVGDVEALLGGDALAGERFDTIILADVLEHLRDPWTVLKTAGTLLSPDGEIILSLPNVRHVSTLFSLLVLGRWPYRERGIHDRTHLRFFTRKNILDLVENAGLQVDTIQAKYRLLEAPSPINRWAKYLAAPGLRGLLAFQYLVRARR